MKRIKTDGIVFHRAEVFTGDDYHFLIMRDGTIKPLVPHADVGWHSCAYNQTTIAIAVFGDFASSEPGLNWYPTKAQIQATIDLVEQMRAIYPTAVWGAGHSELGHKGTQVLNKLVTGHTCPGEHFPLADVILRTQLQPFTFVKHPTNLIVYPPTKALR